MLQLQAVCLKRNPKHIGAQALFQVIHLCRLTGEATYWTKCERPETTNTLHDDN